MEVPNDYDDESYTACWNDIKRHLGRGAYSAIRTVSRHRIFSQTFQPTGVGRPCGEIELQAAAGQELS